MAEVVYKTKHEGERGFHVALDERPDEQTTRYTFADWLQDRDDDRAEGYRALARLGLVLCDRYTGEPVRFMPQCGSRVFCHGRSKASAEYTLPADWFALMLYGKEESEGSCKLFPTRHAAEESAVAAFTKLPEERRAQLLSGDMGTAEELAAFCTRYEAELVARQDAERAAANESE